LHAITTINYHLIGYIYFYTPSFMKFQDYISSGLIVSCQIDTTEPLHKGEHIALFAQAAQEGGAVAVRADGVHNIVAIRRQSKIPIIGCVRGTFDSGNILVTPELRDVEELVRSSCTCIALDATLRIRPNGMDGVEFLATAREQFRIPFVADISTAQEARLAEDAGAVAVSTVLFGRTDTTQNIAKSVESYAALVRDITQTVTIPVLAEGFVWNPNDVEKARMAGAYCTVAGGVITRPRLLTQIYSQAFKEV
jgi:N-acylglucosamine-6-phosphate 2-epimerase